MRSIVATLIASALSAVGFAADHPGAEAATAPGGWTLAWSDEFDKDGPPDPATWGYEQGFVRNHELQWYQPENATCTGGVLVIEARRESKPNPNFKPAGTGWQNRERIAVTSACVISKGKKDFTLGRIEMRARIDARLGSWPAFWTLGSDIDTVGWPKCGEVDIMEYYNSTVLANICRAKGDQAVWISEKKPLAELGGEAWAKEFHIWSMQWDETSVDLFLDGQPRAHLACAADDDAGRPNAFRGPHYLLLNQAIGGDSGGDPSGLDYPVRFEVDWVRVYKKTTAAK